MKNYISFVNDHSGSMGGPIPVQPRYDYFYTREAARRYCAAVGIPQSQIINNGKQAANARRWSVPTVKKVA